MMMLMTRERVWGVGKVGLVLLARGDGRRGADTRAGAGLVMVLLAMVVVVLRRQC